MKDIRIIFFVLMAFIALILNIFFVFTGDLQNSFIALAFLWIGIISAEQEVK